MIIAVWPLAGFNMAQQPVRQCTSTTSSTNYPCVTENGSNVLSSTSGWRTAGTTPDGRLRMLFGSGSTSTRVLWNTGMDSRPGLTTTSPSSGTRTGRSNTRTLPPDALLECTGRTRGGAFEVRQSDGDYPVTVVETEAFLTSYPRRLRNTTIHQPALQCMGAGTIQT